MKLQGNPKIWTVTQSQFGQIIGVSQQRVSQLINEQVLMKDEGSKSGAILLIDSLREYYLSKQAAKDGAESINYWKERALLTKKQRELAELKLEKERGNFYEAAEVEAVITEMLVKFRNKLTGIAAKLSPQLEGKTLAQINSILAEEIEDNLNELASEMEGANFVEVNENENDNGTEKYVGEKFTSSTTDDNFRMGG